jgi:hypothetical protein
MKHRPWYRRKRVLLPCVSLVALVLVSAIALVRSDASLIMVFNETGAPLAAIHLTACGQSANFPALPEDASIRWKLEKHGEPSELGLEVASEPPVRWQGGYVEPSGGHRVTLRIWPDGQVEEHRQISFWQRLLKGAPDINQ